MTLLLLLLIPLVGACGLQLLPKESPWVRRTALAVPVAVLVGATVGAVLGADAPRDYDLRVR